MPANVIVVFRGFSDVINVEVIDKQALYDFTFGRFVPERIIESDQSTYRMLVILAHNCLALHLWKLWDTYNPT